MDITCGRVLRNDLVGDNLYDGKVLPPKTVALNQKRTTTMIMTDMADNDGYIC